MAKKERSKFREYNPTNYGAPEKQEGHIVYFQKSYDIFGIMEEDELLATHEGVFASEHPQDNYDRLDKFGVQLAAEGARRLRRQNGGALPESSDVYRWLSGVEEFVENHNTDSNYQVLFLPYRAKTPNMGLYGFKGLVAVKRYIKKISSGHHF